MGEMRWRVLCVDDVEDNARNAKELLEDWDDSPFGPIEACICTDFDRALERLGNERFDLLVLDLHGVNDPKPEEDPQFSDQEGQQLLKKLKERFFIPVIFVTGYSLKLKDNVTPIVKVVTKSTIGTDLYSAAKEIHETGIPDVVKHLQESQRAYLWDTVYDRWGEFRGELSSSGHHADIAYLLSRRLSAALAKKAIKEYSGDPGETVVPIEHYIYPVEYPEIVGNGNIYQSESGEYWIVITPACDLEHGKADLILMLQCIPVMDYEVGFRKKLVGSKRPARYWFLPGTVFLPDNVVDFQAIGQFAEGDVSAMKSLCQLDLPFRQPLSLAFGHYYSRLGMPDLSPDSLEIIRLRTGTGKKN